MDAPVRFNLVLNSPDRRLLYLSLRLLLDGLLLRQQQLQRVENYTERTSLAKLLRLHRSMSFKLVGVLRLDMAQVSQWPSIKQVVSQLPSQLRQHFYGLQLQFTHDAATDPTVIGQQERALINWLRLSTGYFEAPLLRSLLADMIAAWQVCLESINADILRVGTR
ncbi:hypothetical protein HR45_03725 [Shewanella mangrovi]|uniref:Uncharacterized protein n=1 Tax=Shewanella mangrovi TaxID=1515746 RepID=A0A094JF36_9GAMM|nr:hypothetical protein [Shewanella mangrovi]KFZ38545.1 hypothetical protein HR45_03725 [Shewanella mangrovi]